MGGDPEILAGRFESVDVAGGDQKGIAEALTTFLTEDAQKTPDEVSKIIAEGEQLLGTALPSLGIEVLPVVDGVDGNLPEAPAVKETTVIENVHDFKASLPVSVGPRPVTDLKNFEELEPKL